MALHNPTPPCTPQTSDREERLVKHIADILTLATAKEEPLPADLQDIKKLPELHALLWGIRHLAYSLSTGELEYICRERGFVVGALKAFQSNLRHLTWQAQRIARGEYNHRVNFLGDFSVAFNQMAEQLDTTINSLTCMTEEYKDLSHRDPLTGLYNRYAFFQFAEQILQKNATQPQNATLIMTDIDLFKNVNDTYGHLCGDEVLRQFSQKLLSALRSKDLCCRYGGEEFVILMPDTPFETGTIIAERLRQAVQEMTITFGDKQIRITSSFGLSEVYGADTMQTFEDYINACIQHADTNLYKAKSSGRNRVVAERLAGNSAPPDPAPSLAADACPQP